jgi:peptide chain release factor 2
MSQFTDRLDHLNVRLQDAWRILRLEETRARHQELEEKMGEADFWNDPDRARAIAQEVSDMSKELAAWEGVKKELAGLHDLYELAQADPVDQKEAENLLTALENHFAQLEFQMLLAGEFDQRNAIVSIHAGAGGTDANDWAAMLYRMVLRFAETRGWQVEFLEESLGESTGYKSVSFIVRGRYAYGYLKSEHGVHRLVRISPFDAEQMRHTTFGLIEVLPEFADVDASSVELDPDDLRIDTYLSSGKGGQSVNTTYSAIRITHLPTNTVVSCQNERSQSQNKATALNVLRSKLYRLMVEARAKSISEVKGEHKTAAWGNQIRSYVLHPYKMVKDHRTDEETSDTEAVLNGGLTPFIEAYLRLKAAEAQE